MKLDILQAAVVGLVLISPRIAQAQAAENGAATALKSACRQDYRLHCTGNDPAPPVAAACLAQFYVNLSKNCQAALEAYNAPAGETSDQ